MYIELLRAWNELVEQASFGVLTSADRDYVEAAAKLKYRIRFEKWTSGDVSQLDKFLGKMGLNPADRLKVSGVKKTVETASEWAKLAERRNGSSKAPRNSAVQ
jgi:hypothetical protein